ncbi:MAG: ElyC/SanA/YdcF family protein [Victivallales bacterium]|nr:ElyC/SanA/YdcF family protein [Victivallales bacterium]
MMMTQQQIAADLNILGAFCGVRDIEAPTPAALRRRYAWAQADILILFGGSILAGGEVAAAAMTQRLARKYMIVGGEGHTTAALRGKMREVCPEMDTAGRSEAELFSDYLNLRHGLTPDYLECESTNCGNNVTNCLAVLQQHHCPCRHVIIIQDATMQRRMDAGFRKFLPGATIVNFAAYRAEVVVRGGQLAYREEIPGMWEPERYLSLLLGEIPRLTDDADGYGPQGRNYIAHVEVPRPVREAYRHLREEFPSRVRIAEDRYASR